MLRHWSQLVPNNYVSRHSRTLSNTTEPDRLPHALTLQVIVVIVTQLLTLGRPGVAVLVAGHKGVLVVLLHLEAACPLGAVVGPSDVVAALLAACLQDLVLLSSGRQDHEAEDSNKPADGHLGGTAGYRLRCLPRC